MGNYLVGCDVGTGGTKAVLIDEEGTVLGSHFVEYPLRTTRPGWAEHDPECYWQAVVETISSSIQEARVDVKHIRGVSVSALSPACILVDKNLQPLQQAHIWMDRRATAECRWSERIALQEEGAIIRGFPRIATDVSEGQVGHGPLGHEVDISWPNQSLPYDHASS